jgi:beta-lactamase superfamily II metal-dependent hydrolase
MYYYPYYYYFPDDILVYIEEIDRDNNIIILDFIDSNELEKFTNVLEIQNDIFKASMVKIINYRQKNLRENTVYAIDRDFILNLRSNIEPQEDSFLFGYTIDLKNERAFLFKTSVTIGEQDKYIIGAIIRGGAKNSILDISLKGKINVTVRNIGQGNWNEIYSNDEVKIVYDAGAPMNANKTVVRNHIGNKVNEYSTSKPSLILSHWDKDHYHALIGMTDAELQCFSSFICPDIRPNITSRILYDRIQNAIGKNNIYTVSNIPEVKGLPPALGLISPVRNNFMIFNSTYNKDRNQAGIVLAIKTNISSIILPGDCHYALLSNCILPLLNHTHLHNLIVPHHGGKGGAYDYDMNPGTTPGQAVISVGANRYGHPNRAYTTALTLDRFQVMSTQKVGSDITINL